MFILKYYYINYIIYKGFIFYIFLIYKIILLKRTNNKNNEQVMKSKKRRILRHVFAGMVYLTRDGRLL